MLVNPSPGAFLSGGAKGFPSGPFGGSGGRFPSDGGSGFPSGPFGGSGGRLPSGGGSGFPSGLLGGSIKFEFISDIILFLHVRFDAMSILTACVCFVTETCQNYVQFRMSCIKENRNMRKCVDFCFLYRPQIDSASS